MNTVTLSRAKEISEILNNFKGEPEYNELVTFARKKIGATAHEVSMVLTFLKEFQTIEILDTNFDIQAAVEDLANKPIDLANELQYNYAVAKTLLKFIISKNTLPDGEEIRKTLREISRFSDAMLKMQERVYNIQQMQIFQEKVMDIISKDEKMLSLMLEADL